MHYVSWYWVGDIQINTILLCVYNFNQFRHCETKLSPITNPKHAHTEIGGKFHERFVPTPILWPSTIFFVPMDRLPMCYISYWQFWGLYWKLLVHIYETGLCIYMLYVSSKVALPCRYQLTFQSIQQIAIQSTTMWKTLYNCDIAVKPHVFTFNE